MQNAEFQQRSNGSKLNSFTRVSKVEFELKQT
jgi:hypothetical protein